MATIIYDAVQLQAMSGDLTADYELGSDIDATDTVNWNGGAGFIPIGNLAAPFTGTLDGKGRKIVGLVIVRNADSDVGLIGRLDTGGEISNLGMEDCDITCYQGGSIVGYNAGMIDNCWSSGDIRHNNSAGDNYAYLGGFAWYNEGTITNSYTSCDITVTNANYLAYLGGFVENSEGTITACYATGSITATATFGVYAGGFMEENHGSVNRCFATGDVTATGTQFCGGAGFAYYQGAGSITDSYSRGDTNVTATVQNAWSGSFISENRAELENCYSTGESNSTAGGVALEAGFCRYDNGGTIIACFWDTETSGQAASDGGTGKTTIVMKLVATFQAAEWAISRIWNVFLSCNDSYPCLIGVNTCCSPRLAEAVSQNRVSLEAIRNLEIVYGGRFYIDKSGNAAYESRYHRNV